MTANSFKLACLVVVLSVSCKESSSLGLFQSLDFARDALMQFSSGETQTVQVKKLVKKRPDLPNSVKKKTGIFSISWHGSRLSLSKASLDLDGSSSFISSSLGHPAVSKARPITSKQSITSKRISKVYGKRSSPSNHFLAALSEIERAMAETRASGRRQRFSQAQLAKLKSYIKLGSKHRSYHFARRAIGQALYLLQLRGLSRRRGKRSPQNTAKGLLSNLRKKMSPGDFDKLLAVQGDVTLMFAIDTTGSMSDEIESAKKIAIDVVNHDRNNPVNYILSPFNDPKTGPLEYHEEGESADFVKSIEALTASGGGDCPELTFEGLLNALEDGPRWGSPMYVFTDATAKDATAINIEVVKTYVETHGVTVNFFTTGTCRSNGPDHFKNLADISGGQVIRLSSAGELLQLSGLTGSVLGGSNTISVGSSQLRRGKRSTSNNHHSIIIDDSIENVTVSVTTENQNSPSSPFDVKLKDPSNVVITSGKVALSRIYIYQIQNPMVGTWKLTCPARAGKCEFVVKGSSPTNIDFEHSFMLLRTRGRRIDEIPILYPVIGKSTHVLVTVAGADKVRRGSLKLKFITKYGDLISSHSLQPRGKTNVHYMSSFTAPAQSFKLKLEGTTIAGNPFQRISRNIVTPKSVILRVVHARNHFTLPIHRTTFVIFEIISGLKYTETFTIKAKSKLGYTVSMRRTTKVARAGHWASFSVRLRSTQNSDVGKTEYLKVSVTGRRSQVKSVQIVQLLVVDS